jgi:hypothetical protein
LDGGGAVLSSVALFFLAAQDKLTEGDELSGIFVYLCFWIAAPLGTLLFLGRPLLKYRLRHGWAALLVIGAVLAIEGPDLVGSRFVRLGQSLLFSYWDMNTRFLGFACFLVGLIIGAVQWLVIKEPDEKAPVT